MEKFMIEISATKLRNNLFHYLEKAIDGETIIVYRNKKQVAKLAPVNVSNWRDQIKIRFKILVPPDEIIKPEKDIWKDYV